MPPHLIKCEGDKERERESEMDEKKFFKMKSTGRLITTRKTGLMLLRLLLLSVLLSVAQSGKCCPMLDKIKPARENVRGASYHLKLYSYQRRLLFDISELITNRELPMSFIITSPALEGAHKIKA